MEHNILYSLIETPRYMILTKNEGTLNNQESWNSGKYDNGYILGTTKGSTLEGWAEGKEKSTLCMYSLFCRFQIDSSSILKNQGN